MLHKQRRGRSTPKNPCLLLSLSYQIKRREFGLHPPYLKCSDYFLLVTFSSTACCSSCKQRHTTRLMDEWKPFVHAWSLIFSAKAYDLCNSRECRAAGPKFSSKVECQCCLHWAQGEAYRLRDYGLFGRRSGEGGACLLNSASLGIAEVHGGAISLSSVLLPRIKVSYQLANPPLDEFNWAKKNVGLRD